MRLSALSLIKPLSSESMYTIHLLIHSGQILFEEAIGYCILFTAPSQQKAGFCMGPVSCLSTHEGILEYSGISDSRRHPCVGSWVEPFITVSPVPCQFELMQLRNALDAGSAEGELSPSTLLHAQNKSCTKITWYHNSYGKILYLNGSHESQILA